MCELLGMSANVPTDICFSFSGLIQRGGRTGPHKDGWGISFYVGRGCQLFHDPASSASSEIASLIQGHPIKSHTVISHIRLANRGKVCLENTHPFCREMWGRHWTFAHNGQLKGIKKRPLVNFHPVGTTDSEYAFCWMLDQVRSRYPEKPERGTGLRSLVQDLCADLNTLGTFNILMSDSEHLYAFCSRKLCWITRRAPFGAASLIDAEMSVDFGTETTPQDIVSVIATRPLTDNENWTEMTRGEFLVLKKGNVLANSHT
jgi:predicted glutamine amidotransferase